MRSKDRSISVKERYGRQLIITLTSGKKITFTDSKEDDTQGKWYHYQEYFPAIKYHLIQVQYYEGRGYIFLNADNGKYNGIPDVPLVSPDNKRIAIIDLDYAYSKPSIEIMQITDKEIIKEFSLSLKGYYDKGNLQWLDNDNIKITIEVPVSGKEIKYSNKYFFLYQTDTGWKTKDY